MKSAFLILAFIILFSACDKSTGPESTVRKGKAYVQWTGIMSDTSVVFSFEKGSSFKIYPMDINGDKGDFYILVGTDIAGKPLAGYLTKDNLADSAFADYPIDKTDNATFDSLRKVPDDISWESQAYISKAGQIIFFKTADKKFAKMQVTYFRMWREPFGSDSVNKVRADFDWEYQTDGSKNFE